MIFFPIICASLFIALPRIISAVPVSADPDFADPVSGDDGYINNPSSGKYNKNQSPKGIKWLAVPLPCSTYLGFHRGSRAAALLTIKKKQRLQ